MSHPFQLIGQIKDLQKVKVYGKNHRGKYYWKIFPQTPQSKVKQIFVFPEIVETKVYQALENFNCYGKTLVFSCQKYTSVPGNYKLLNWEELPELP